MPRAENRHDDLLLDGEFNSQTHSDLPQFPRGRVKRGQSKLKKSKKMQALAAALASKNKLAKDVDDPPLSQLEEHPIVSHSEPNEVQIPYIYPDEPLDNDPQDLCILPKPIYIISDCTGDSAAKTVKAALMQFESSIREHCPASLVVHKFVSEEERIHKVVEQAALENAIVVFTLVDPELVTDIKTACALYEVKYVDLWSDLLDMMEDHLDTMRSILPINHPNRSGRRHLDPDYFHRIEAVEFTRKMDDGAHPERWHEADILILGVSRCGKTPLSIYLGQRGFKVANLPLVRSISIPPQLYEIDQSKIFALTIDAQHLFKIRRSRVKKLGVKKHQSMYADLKHVVEELDFAHGLYKRNPMWPVLDVTMTGVEETAAKIQRILSDRHGHSETLIYA